MFLRLSGATLQKTRESEMHLTLDGEVFEARLTVSCYWIRRLNVRIFSAGPRSYLLKRQPGGAAQVNRRPQP